MDGKEPAHTIARSKQRPQRRVCRASQMIAVCSGLVQIILDYIQVWGREKFLMGERFRATLTAVLECELEDSKKKEGYFYADLPHGVRDK